MTLNGIAYTLALTLTPNSVAEGTPSSVTASWTALDNSGATIVGPGTIVDQDGNAVVPQLADGDTTGDTSIGKYNGTADSWPITSNDGDISSPAFTLSAPGNAGLSPVTQVLTASAGLTTLTTTDSSLTLGRYGVGYPKYGRVAPPVSVECVPSNCDVKYPGLYIYNSARQAIWNIEPDGWKVNATASGSSTVEYTGSGSIVATVDFTGLTPNTDVNGGPLIIYGSQAGREQPALGQGFNFPLQLSSLYALSVDIAYTLDNRMTPGNQDIMFDEWLMPTSTYHSGNSGAVECEVKTYTNFGQPGADLTGTISEPVTVNGTTTNKTFDEYYNGKTPGNTPNVTFVLQGSATGNPTGWTSGEVAFNILPFLNRCAGIVPGVGSSWYVPGMLLSTEYGTEHGGTSVDYTLTVTKILYQEVLH